MILTNVRFENEEISVAFTFLIFRPDTFSNIVFAFFRPQIVFPFLIFRLGNEEITMFFLSQNELIFGKNFRFCLKKHLKNFRLRRAISKKISLRRVFIFLTFFESEIFWRFLIFSKFSWIWPPRFLGGGVLIINTPVAAYPIPPRGVGGWVQKLVAEDLGVTFLSGGSPYAGRSCTVHIIPRPKIQWCISFWCFRNDSEMLYHPKSKIQTRTQTLCWCAFTPRCSKLRYTMSCIS